MWNQSSLEGVHKLTCLFFNYFFVFCTFIVSALLLMPDGAIMRNERTGNLLFNYGVYDVVTFCRELRCSLRCKCYING